MSDKFKVNLISYNSLEYSQEDVSIDKLADVIDKNKVDWVNVKDIDNVEIINQIGSKFGLDRLTLEDIQNKNHRPKIEEFEDYTFFIIKKIQFSKKTNNFKFEHICLVLFDNLLITFCKDIEKDFFTILKRINNPKGRHRNSRAEYLCYTLIDTLVDDYINIIEDLDDSVDDIESLLNSNKEVDKLLPHKIFNLKREISVVIRNIVPLKEGLSSIMRGDSFLSDQSMEKYLVDLEDHLNFILEKLEAARENLSELLTLHHTIANMRMNEIMKFLTVIASIFIPLSFLVGIYGMNFENMPELEWEYGYFIVLGIAFSIIIGAVAYFKKKKWI